MRHVLLGVTGSVAAIKTRKLFDRLSEDSDVQVIATRTGYYFMNDDWPRDSRNYRLLLDRDDLDTSVPFRLGDPILHIELRRWASALVIAPLDANTLAKLANGMCDNLLTSVFRAWDWTKPVFVAPAMNTMMWENDPTASQLEILKHRGVTVIDPVEKMLACNDVGMGAMAPIQTIASMVKSRLRWQFPIEGCPGIPINHHPGAFGFHRRKNHHTGIDLYCRDGTIVKAVENGTIVKIDQFTGPELGHEWWERTWGIMVEGPSGVVNYGEVNEPAADIHVGKKLERGEPFAAVKRVLFSDKHRPDIPGHSTSMLHLELYKTGTRDFADWHDLSKNPDLSDPTQYLITAEWAPSETLTWDNAEGKVVG